MSEDNNEKKSRLHIHTGGLIVLIIIILILFKVDIKSKIQSPQFQENISFIGEQTTILWQKYIIGPIKTKGGEIFINYANKQLKDFEDNLNK